MYFSIAPQQITAVDQGFTAWLFNQGPSVVLLVIFVVAILRGMLRTSQEVAAINEAKTAYKAYVDELVPVVKGLTSSLSIFSETTKANQIDTLNKLDAIHQSLERNYTQLSVIAERRSTPRETREDRVR